MNKNYFINKKINNFKKKITVEVDKSLSIRWAFWPHRHLGNLEPISCIKSEDVEILSVEKNLE